MKSIILKQVFFLIGATLILVILMGFFFFSNAHGATPQSNSEKGFRANLTTSSWGDDWEEDGDEWDEEWDADWDSDVDEWVDGDRTGLMIRYNRVEGLMAGMRIKKEYWRSRDSNRPFIYGHWGYAFAAKEFQYMAGLEKGLFDTYRFGFGGEYHRMIDTPDRWIIQDEENSLAAVVLKEDFQDFYLREGGSGYLMQNITEAVTMTAAYNVDQFKSVEKNTNWSIFGGKKQFRPNPIMDEGELYSLSAKLVLDTRNSKRKTKQGWYVQIEGEHAGNDLRGDFTFDRLLVDLRRFQPLGYQDGLDIRLRAGSAWGHLPWQRSYHLGGLSTLRAFQYKAFPGGPDQSGGNRMVLGQIEYRLSRQDLPDEIDLGILEHFYIILFADAGWVENVDENLDWTEGFEDLDYGDFKSDVGLALSNRGGNMRVEIARRTDTSVKPFMFWFRLNRPF
ncbi:BamA/TamA family outer membrane protein [candidate division KSB1 bacterium]|nr:BamA/TamA family outer membrane protein [candidate division KSB1 bacterium]